MAKSVVVATLVDCLPLRVGMSAMYHIFMDNLFSSMKLLCDLRGRKVACTGTTRSNATGFPGVLKVRGGADKSMQWDALGAVTANVLVRTLLLWNGSTLVLCKY